MTDLGILFSTFPLVLVAFEPLAPVRRGLVWLAVGLAAAFQGYWIYLNHLQDWAPLVPVAGCLAVYILEALLKRNPNGGLLLGTLFISQAVLSREPAHVLILITFADMFFCADSFLAAPQSNREPAVSALLRSVGSLLPATIGLLLRLEGTALMISAALTLLIRASSWPFASWASRLGRERRSFLIAIAGASSLALWKNLVPGHDLDWPTAWFCVATFLSFGALSRETAVVLSFGLFNLGAPWSYFAVALWPILIFEGALTYVTALLVAAMGAVIAAGFGKIFNPEAAYAIALTGALLLARVQAGLIPLAPNWVVEGVAILFMGAVTGFVIWLYPETQPPLTPEAVGFAAAYLVFFAVGKMLVRGKPRLFASAKPVSMPHLKPGPLEPRRAPAPEQAQTGWRAARLLAALETEAYLGFLLGAVGAVLLWGLG